MGSAAKSIDSVLLYGNMDLHREPFLSIVIPTRNRLGLLKESILSAVNQEDAPVDFEVVIADNCGDEEVREKIRLFLENLGADNVYYYRNSENIGLYQNWNRSIDLARSKWAAMLHDDDLLYGDYVKTMSNIIRRHKITPENTSYIKTRFTESPDRGPVVVRDIERGGIIARVKKAFRYAVIEIKPSDMDNLGPLNEGLMGAQTCGSLINRDYAISKGGFDPSLYPSSDVVFATNLVYSNDRKVYTTLNSTGRYRIICNTQMLPETIRLYADRYEGRKEFFRSSSRRYAGQLAKMEKVYNAIARRTLLMNLAGRDEETADHIKEKTEPCEANEALVIMEERKIQKRIKRMYLRGFLDIKALLGK